MYPRIQATLQFRTVCTRLPVYSNARHSSPTTALLMERLLVVRPLQQQQCRRWLHNGTRRRILRHAGPREREPSSTMTSRAAHMAKENGSSGGGTTGSPSAPAATAATVVKSKKTLWQKVKDEAIHYWHGTQLLGLEIRISSKLTWKLLNGGHLTRREARQLRRTTSDLLRLIPFAVFVIVPFMELLLPVALKLFPNMLPSTYESKSTEEEKKRKLLKVRLEMARFLQETIAESGFPGSDNAQSAKDFTDFFRKIRMTGEQPATEDLLKVARRFEDELTLDNLSRPQLVSICKYMNINAFGTDNFLRFQIRNRMRQIKADDRVIQIEGIESLTLPELQSACAARGIRTTGSAPERLRDELAQWVDLNINHHVPTTLMILARAFTFTDRPLTTADALRETFNSLPDNLVNETELQVLEKVGQSTYKQKIEVLEQQQELIEDESEQEEKEAKARQEVEAEEKRLEEEKKAADKLDFFISDAQRKEAQEAAAVAAAAAEEDEHKLSAEEKQELHDALVKLRSKVDVLEERTQLNEIKFHHEDYKELVEQLKDATNREADKASLRLSKRLEKMLGEIDKELELLEKEQQKQDEQDKKK